MSNNNFKSGYLDGGKLFEYYYVTMGTARSTPKLREYCKLNGWVNPNTKEPPTRMGLWFAMWRWALDKQNQKTAFEWFKAYKGNGYTHAEWKVDLKSKALTCLNPSAYSKWKVVE